MPASILDLPQEVRSQKFSRMQHLLTTDFSLPLRLPPPRMTHDVGLASSAPPLVPSSRIVKIIIQILSVIGHQTAFYSAKERQADLALAARIHSSFLEPARDLLYSSNSLTIRNAGRSALLAHTLTQLNPELARRIMSISANSAQASGHPQSIIEILAATTHLTELALREDLFKACSSTTAQLKQLICFENALTSFDWICDDTSTLRSVLLHLHHLKHLGIVAYHPTAQLAEPDVICKPRYELKSITLSALAQSRLFELRPQEWNWLLGATRAHGIESMTLKFCTLLRHQPERFFDERFDSISKLSLFSLRGYSLKACLPLFGNNLKHLAYAPENTLGPRVPESTELCHGALPSSLRTITIYGRTEYVKLGLPSLLEEGEFPQLELVLLVGPFSSDPELMEMHKVVDQIKGCELQIRRSFTAS